MDRWTTGLCKANGIEIHYTRTGGQKPPLILLHGLMTNGTCWTPIARILQEDYDIFLPDARGHGRSSTPEQGYSYEEHAADVISLIDTLGLVQPVLVGHSMGGMTAAVVASRSPERLSGLVLADPTFLLLERQKEVYASNVAEQHRKILQEPKEDLLAKLRLRHKHRPQELLEQFTEARLQTSVHAFEVLKPPNPDYQALIQALSLPCLLVIGSENPVVSPEIAAELVRLNPLLQTAQIREAGHGLPFDQPAAFSAAVQTFCRSLAS